MTDEKLNQILKQALAPEISGREIRIHRRRKDKMNKFGKIGKGAAAAAAAGLYLRFYPEDSVDQAGFAVVAVVAGPDPACLVYYPADPVAADA